MARYTEQFLAAARHGYENTDQPMRELSRELGIGITTLSTLAETHGWAKRSLRKRGLPPAMQLLAEVQALAAGGPAHSRASGNPESAQQQAEEELGPRFRGDERSINGPPEPAELLIKLEQILAQFITAQQLAHATVPSDKDVRRLTLLINSLRALKEMRGAAPIVTGTINDDDDMPRDIDEFRHALARRIRVFVEGRIRARDAGGNAASADVAAAE